MKFEWDSKKAGKNLQKHGVSFQDATSVFGDPLAITYDDPDHSIEENRFLTFGITQAGKMVIVCHTQRKGSIRIISARPMENHERDIYEKG